MLLCFYLEWIFVGRRHLMTPHNSVLILWNSLGSSTQKADTLLLCLLLIYRTLERVARRNIYILFQSFFVNGCHYNIILERG